MKKIFFLPLLVFCSCVHTEPVDDILSKHIDFTGGETKWKTINTIVTSGEYDYGGTKFPFTAYSKAPNKYKFIVPFNGKYYAQAYNGTSGWRIDAFKDETKPTMLTGKEALAMANESDVELESAFINYKAKGHTAVLEEKDTVIQNNACRKVVFTRKSGEKEWYYFDAKSFSLVMKKAVSKNAEMGGSVLTTFYSDYRDVGGVKIPFRAASDINGQAILTITIEKAEVNVAVEEKEFLP